MSNDKDAIAKSIMARAREFAADPQEGFAAGYQPKPKFQQSREIGGTVGRTRVNSDEQAWAEGIAEKDLPHGTWRLLSVMGGEAIIEIF